MELRMMEVVATTEGFTCTTVQSYSQIVTTNKNQYQAFYWSDALNIAQPTVSEH